MPYGKKEESAATSYPYWIIVNRKRGSIWQGMNSDYKYASYDDAKTELDFQTISLKDGETGKNWVIEKVEKSS